MARSPSSCAIQWLSHFSLVPGGGIFLDGTRWISCRPHFFLPVRVLSRLFRRLFLQYLQEAFDSGKLRFFSSLATLQDPQAFNRHLDPVRSLKWVVNAKPPFAGPQQVVNYAGRYTHPGGHLQPPDRRYRRR